MSILAYDDVMLREPRLLVPGQKPLGSVKLNNVARSLQSKVVLMPRLVGEQNIHRGCTISGGAFAPDGSYVVSATSNYLAIPKGLGFLPYLAPFTLRLRYKTTTATLSSVFGSNVNGAGTRSIRVLHHHTTATNCAFVVGSSAGAWSDEQFTVTPFDVTGIICNEFILMHSPSFLKDVYLNGVKSTDTGDPSTGLENDATHTQWQVNTEPGVGGLGSGTYELLQAWPFLLTPAEVMAIRQDPYSMFDPA